jgi:hypothetical protein
MATEVIVRGVVDEHGHLTVPDPVAIPPGEVEVRVTPVPSDAGRKYYWWEVVEASTTERPLEEIDADLRALRDEWERDLR